MTASLLNSRLGFATKLLVIATAIAAVAQDDQALVALYDFQATTGNHIPDVSGQQPPLDLVIANPAAVVRAPGTLTVQNPTLISTAKPPQRLIDAVRRSGEFTVEAWIRSAAVDQEGPARIVSLSVNTTERNFTLGQENDRFDCRFRTTKTNRNGTPSLASPVLSPTELAHLVYVRDRQGRARLYRNGRRIADKSVPGDTSNWLTNARLALANELTNDRPWRGTYHRVAIYAGALTDTQVAQRFADAPTKTTQTVPATAVVNAAPSKPAATSPAPPSANAPAAHYDFRTITANRIIDNAPHPKQFDLSIHDPAVVTVKDGALTFHRDGLVHSAEPPRQLIDAIRKSGEFTVEAWLRADNADQDGPARIVSLSVDTQSRNFTLGQDGNRFDFRCRTTTTDANGMPSLATYQLDPTRPTHLVYLRDRNGDARLFINGRHAAHRQIPGTTANWTSDARLALGNELTRDRPWRGTLYQVAIFSRTLSRTEIFNRFEAGKDELPEAAPVPPPVDTSPAGRAPDHLFELEVAPILANHCLECHDAATRKGGLDLSTYKTALAGGDEGPAIVPNNLAESLLWQSVESDDMPHKRDPLTAAQKATLKRWLLAGAPWTADRLDPAVYAAVYAAGRQTDTNLVRRLTIPEYVDTVRSTFAVDVADDAHRLLPPDLRADGFSNTAYNLTVDFKHVAAYAKLAELTAQRLDPAAFAKRFSSSRRMIDKDMIKLIENMGAFVLRGPLPKHEVARYRGLTTTVMATNGTFDDAIRLLVEAMMQSPRFLYHLDAHANSPAELSPHALAARLSYVVTGAPPDDQLLKAAKDNQLRSDAQIRDHLQRLLNDPRAERQAVRFVEEWLHLDRLASMRPNPDRFPGWQPQLGTDMRRETIAFFTEVAWRQNRPMSELFNAQLTFATPALARHYGLPPKDTEFTSYKLDQVPSRGGLLTQASVLTVGGDHASTVTRGLFVFRDVLRGVVKSPPAGVDTTPIPAKPGQSNRIIAEYRIKDKSCGGCHSKFEPLSFALEKYDGLGAFSDRDEHGNQLRQDGNILIPGAAEPVPYKTTAELMDLLATSDRVKETLTWKLTQFALGRPLGPADRHQIAQIHQQAMTDGGTYRNTITAICLSNLIRN